VAQNPPLRYRGEKYWGRPLPGFGDPDALIYIVGLAPAANGGNRTGRIFTGDRSGDFLYATLYQNGLSSHSQSVRATDPMTLFQTYIGASVRCAPPDNKPTLEEFANCHPYLEREFSLLANVRVIVALGGIAYNSIKKLFKNKTEYRTLRFPAFGHGVQIKLPDGRVILCSYHPSQQNTFTGRLTMDMLTKIFSEAGKLAGVKAKIARS
jgi:uracil-DNA glycosylase family 4